MDNKNYKKHINFYSNSFIIWVEFFDGKGKSLSKTFIL